MSIRQIVHGLFGVSPAQSGLHHTPTVESAPPLAEMMDALLTLSDEQWGLYAFSREALRGRFDMQERIVLTKESIACGQYYAQKMKAAHGVLSPVMYAEKLGLEVQRLEKPSGGAHVLFAQFAPPITIRLFTDCLDKAARLMEQEQAAGFIDTGALVDILLAHELFHYVEEMNRESIYTKTETIELWRLGPLKNASPISCLSEIAGMYFAKELCGVSFSPYLLDVFLVYAYNPAAAGTLFNGILRVTNAQV